MGDLGGISSNRVINIYLVTLMMKAAKLTLAITLSRLSC